jgi:hypothetical protein
VQSSRQYTELQRNEERRKTQRLGITVDTVAGLLPWREVVEPHQDVATGEFQQAEFAADLAKVHNGSAPSEYRDPHEFYSRTYLTEGLSNLLVGAAKRLSGGGGDAVVDLQTNFGGGKTHSMLALYHMAAQAPTGDLPGLDQLLSREGLTVPGPFAYAERWDEAKQAYAGLAISVAGNVQVVIDSESVIVRPEVAERHRPGPANGPGPVPPGHEPVPPVVNGPPPPPDKEPDPTRFIGTVMISSERPAKEMHKVVEAIIEHLTTLPGSEVSLKLEIDAEVPSGLDRAKVRTLLENATTLGFIDKVVK